MPFNDGAIIELGNDSDKVLRDVFFQIGYYEEPTRMEREPTLHAQFRRQRKTREREPFVALQAQGNGWLAGLRTDIQSQAWWLKPPFRDIALPRGFGLGLLEGWEEIVIDGDLANPIRRDRCGRLFFCGVLLQRRSLLHAYIRFTCHKKAMTRDYVFTEYANR